MNKLRLHQMLYLYSSALGANTLATIWFICNGHFRRCVIVKSDIINKNSFVNIEKCAELFFEIVSHFLVCACPHIIFNLFFVCKALIGEQYTMQYICDSACDNQFNRKNGRILQYKIFSAKMHAQNYKVAKTHTIFPCMYTFMPNIFHSLFHSPSIRTCIQLRCNIFAGNRKTHFVHHQKYLLPKFNTWESAGIHKTHWSCTESNFIQYKYIVKNEESERGSEKNW